MPDYQVVGEPAEYDVLDCICEDEHFQIDGIAFYNVVTRSVKGTEQVIHEGEFTYACPALFDEFTVAYAVIPDESL